MFRQPKIADSVDILVFWKLVMLKHARIIPANLIEATIYNLTKLALNILM